MMERIRPIIVGRLISEEEEQVNVREGNSDLPPEASQQHLERAYISEEKSEFEKALAECELAIQLDPNWAEAHNFRGIILEELNQGEKAIIAYREAVRLDPAFDEARKNLLEAEAELEKKKSLEAEVTSTIEKAKRPGIVTAICWFYWLNTLILGAFGVIGALLMIGPYLNGVRPLNRMSAEMPGILFGCGSSVVIVALAVFFAVVGWGPWRLKR